MVKLMIINTESTIYMGQPNGVGQKRTLNTAQAEHIVCLLRVIERLPLLSEQIVCSTRNESCEVLYRHIEALHANHIELAMYAAAVLIDGD